ncbi:MAG: hypothetical protein HY770_07740 [Chitinivibrionia bacterium]|nr:hypothetical protein [Chitinivibrionia bacterium]
MEMLKRIHVVSIVVAFCLTCACLSSADAAKLSIPLAAASISTHASSIEALGDYYTISINIPEQIKGKELYGAYLELYVDVNALEYQGQVNNAPSLDVYALKAAFSGSEDANQFGQSSFGPRNVVLGENKRVLIDITNIIRAYLQNPGLNHGLILGSLTGMRDGLFTIRKDVVSKGAFGQINYFYDDRVQ